MIEKTDSEHNENSAFVKIQIKHRFIEAVLFECEAPERMRSELRMRYAVEKAVSSHTNLAGAYLAGAYLANGVMLLGDRPIFQVGPIGSRCAPLIAYITDKGLRFDAGCQRQLTREKLDEQIALTHGDNKYAREYRAALAMIDVHAEIWTPKADDSGKNQESEQKTQ